MKLAQLITAVALLFTLGACSQVPTTELETAAAAQVFKVDLSGENEVRTDGSAVTGDASGRATVILKGNRLTVNGVYRKLSSDPRVVAGSPAHIHRGAEGTNGPIAFTLELVQPGKQTGAFKLRTELTDAQAADFSAGLYYINLHTQNNPAGELRGQID